MTLDALEEYRNAIAMPEFGVLRRKVCRTLATQLTACGERLWAFGSGPVDFRTALSVAVQFGGSLGTGAAALGDQANWYAASALVRQFIEVEYLVRLFRDDPGEALTWLKASPADLRASFSPARMRMRLGERIFRYQEYRVHCNFGGHPNPSAHVLLPARYLNPHLSPLGNEVFWVDLGQHLKRAWRDLAALPSECPTENLNVILEYASVATEAIQAWEDADPCSRRIPVSLLEDWASKGPSDQRAPE